ncbi:hypothetical protein NMG60_11033661 [Bertholletia excelsa]
MVILREEGILSPLSGSTYDVFLSFTYVDVGKKFVDHLYSSLRNGFRIFKHNENMEKGENIRLKLQKTIKESRMSIVVFSKGYVFSSWCLDELEMILQHRASSSGHHVLPIFYDVDPSHMRRQMESFKEAFESYEEGERENGWKSRVEGWKAALREAADLAGMDLQNDANGVNLLEKKKSWKCINWFKKWGERLYTKNHLWIQGIAVEFGITKIPYIYCRKNL